MAHYPKIFDFRANPIDTCEIAFGNTQSSGITSSNLFLFDTSGTNLIMGGTESTASLNVATGSFVSSIIGGYRNTLQSVTASSIIASSRATITQSNYSGILAGTGSLIISSTNSVIVAGQSNSIDQSLNSAIIGGNNLNLNSENNVVYLPQLKLDVSCESVSGSKNILVWDSDKYVRYCNFSDFLPSQTQLATRICWESTTNGAIQNSSYSIIAGISPSNKYWNYQTSSNPGGLNYFTYSANVIFFEQNSPWDTPGDGSVTTEEQVNIKIDPNTASTTDDIDRNFKFILSEGLRVERGTTWSILAPSKITGDNSPIISYGEGIIEPQVLDFIWNPSIKSSFSGATHGGYEVIKYVVEKPIREGGNFINKDFNWVRRQVGVQTGSDPYGGSQSQSNGWGTPVTFPKGSILFINEAFISVEAVEQSAPYGTFSVGLSLTNVSNNAVGNQVTNFEPPLSTFGINSYQIIFPDRSLGDLATGSIYYSDSQISILKIAEPMRLCIKLSSGETINDGTYFKVVIPYVVDDASKTALSSSQITPLLLNGQNNITKLHWKNDQQTNYTLTSGGATGPTIYYYNTNWYDSPQNISVTLQNPGIDIYKNWKLILSDNLLVGVGSTWSVVYNGETLIKYGTGHIPPQELEFIWSEDDQEYSIVKKNLEQRFEDTIVGSASTGHDFYSHKRILRGKFPQSSSTDYNPTIYAVMDSTSMNQTIMDEASGALKSWFESWVQTNGVTQSKMYVMASAAEFDGVVESWLAIPEMIHRGTLPIASTSNFVIPYVASPDGLGGITYSWATASGNLTQSFNGTLYYNENLTGPSYTGVWNRPTDLILISFFDESHSAYHEDPFGDGLQSIWPGSQPTPSYQNHFERFVGTYSPVTGINGIKFDTFKGIIYPVVRGSGQDDSNDSGGITSNNMLNGICAALVLQALAAWSGVTLTEEEIDGEVEFGGQFINGVSHNASADYPGDPFALITGNETSGWNSGWERINVEPLLTSNPYSGLTDSQGDPGLWKHGWIVSLDKRRYNSDGSTRQVFEPITFTNDINNILGVNVLGTGEPFLGIFPSGSIIFVEEAFYTILESLTFSAAGQFAIGLATATTNGYTSSAIETYPGLTQYGLLDSREIFFPYRDTLDLNKYQGHTEISNSPISMVKLTEPAMLMVIQDGTTLQYGEITVHVPYIVDNPSPGLPKPQGPTAYVSARPQILGVGNNLRLDVGEIAWGSGPDGAGITTSNHLRFDFDNCNILFGRNIGSVSTIATGSCWSVNLGKCFNCIDSSDSVAIIAGFCHLISTSSNSSIIGGTSNSIWGSKNSGIFEGTRQSITFSSNSLILGGTGSCITSSTNSSIVGGSRNTLNSSCNSAIMAGSFGTISNSSRSLIIGGSGLTLSNENDVVYLPTLKLNLATQSVNESRVLLWDNDNYVRYATYSTSKTQSIDYQEIAWGTGTGITSSDIFKWYFESANLLAATSSCISNSLYSGIIEGRTHSLTASTDSLILAGSCNTLISATRSVIIGGFSNSVSFSFDSTNIGSCLSCIISSTNSSIVGSRRSCIDNSRNSGVFSGEFNEICRTCHSVIVAGTGSCIISSTNSAIIAGRLNSITFSQDSIISGGRCNCINTNSSFIASSYLSEITGGACSGTILSSKESCISLYARQSSILAGLCNKITNNGSGISFVIFGECNKIYSQNGCNSSILGGCGNSMSLASSNSSIISSICSDIETGVNSTIINSKYASILGGGERGVIIGSFDVESCGLSFIISSTNSSVKTSNYSGIINGFSSSLTNTSCFSTVINSNDVLIKCSKNSSIINSCTSLISAAASPKKGSIIISATKSTICNSNFGTIISGGSQSIFSSENSTIFGIYNNKICNVDCSSILLSKNSRILYDSDERVYGEFSNIMFSLNSCIIGSSFSTIISGVCNLIEYNTTNDLIIGGEKNIIYPNSFQSSIITGCGNSMSSARNGQILGGDCNSIFGGCSSQILGGKDNYTKISCATVVIGGCNNYSCNSDYSGILSSTGSKIYNTTASVIIGGGNNSIGFQSYTVPSVPPVSKTVFVKNSGIIGGNLNSVCEDGSFIAGSYNSTIGGTTASQNYSSIISSNCSFIRGTISHASYHTSIISGQFDLIDSSRNSAIVSGTGSCIMSSTNSIINGGRLQCVSKSLNSGINSGECSCIISSTNSTITGGSKNTICSAGCSTIIGGYCNNICNLAEVSTIINSERSCICQSSQNSLVLSATGSFVKSSKYASILFGGSHSICTSDGSQILGVRSNFIRESCNSSIISSIESKIDYYKNESCGEFNGILFSCQSCVMATTASFILGGRCNRITQACSSILGGYKNLIGSQKASIINSCNSQISGGSCFSVILGGKLNIISDSNNSTIIGSWTSSICPNSVAVSPIHSSIISSYCSQIYGKNDFSLILGGCCNLISDTTDTTGTSYLSTIIGGCCNLIKDSFNSSIISSWTSSIIDDKGGTSSNSSIIASCKSCILSSSFSAIIGGIGLTLSSEPNVVYLPTLKLNSATLSASASYPDTLRVLTWDQDNYVRYITSSAIGGGGEGLEPGITGSTPFYRGTMSWTYSSTNIYNDGSTVGIGITNSATNTYATPSSTLHVFGSLSLNVATTSTNYQLGDKNFTLIAYAPPSGGLTVSLPTASVAKHRVYVIKKADANTNSFIYISPNGTNTIEGYTGSITLESQWDYNILQSDGISMWIKLGGAVGLNL